MPQGAIKIDYPEGLYEPASTDGGSTPTGIIALWYGLAVTVPTGWQIADGTNGTPDLRGKPIWGASNDGEVGTEAGSDTHDHDSHSDHVVTQSGDHAALTHAGAAVADHAAHTHVAGTLAGDTTTGSRKGGTSGAATLIDSHGHTISGATGNPSAALIHSVTQPNDHAAQSHSGAAVDGHSAHSSESNIPAHKKFYWIMKL